MFFWAIFWLLALEIFGMNSRSTALWKGFLQHLANKEYSFEDIRGCSVSSLGELAKEWGYSNLDSALLQSRYEKVQQGIGMQAKYILSHSG